jgi:CRP/FNR family cyclic AMP-dependent transcriptional regulator
MKTIEQLLSEHKFFSGMDKGHVETIAGCAHNEQFPAGAVLFREGDEARRFFIIREGDIALMLHAGSSGSLTVQTLHEGDILGWSWLMPPYQWHFDARANTATRVTIFDGECLRAKCEADPRLGYELMKRFSVEMHDRFMATRMQLLDVYGEKHASS